MKRWQTIAKGARAAVGDLNFLGDTSLAPSPASKRRGVTDRR